MKDFLTNLSMGAKILVRIIRRYWNKFSLNQEENNILMVKRIFFIPQVQQAQVILMTQLLLKKYSEKINL